MRAFASPLIRELDLGFLGFRQAAKCQRAEDRHLGLEGQEQCGDRNAQQGQHAAYGENGGRLKAVIHATCGVRALFGIRERTARATSIPPTFLHLDPVSSGPCFRQIRDTCQANYAESTAITRVQPGTERDPAAQGTGRRRRDRVFRSGSPNLPPGQGLRNSAY